MLNDDEHIVRIKQTNLNGFALITKTARDTFTPA